MKVGDDYFVNDECMKAGVADVLEQAGANVTLGYRGQIDAVSGGRFPINTTYLQAGLCPVNVHWHLGTEHYSVGEYDEHGDGPEETGPTPDTGDDEASRRAGSGVRLGFRCRHYNPSLPKF